MDSRAGEISAARENHPAVDHHEFVMHQSTAFAAVFRVINDRHASLLKQGYGIPFQTFFCREESVFIAIGQLG